MLVLENSIQICHKLLMKQIKIGVDQYVKGEVLLGPNIRSIVDCAVLINADTEGNYHVYRTMVELCDDEHSIKQRNRILAL